MNCEAYKKLYRMKGSPPYLPHPSKYRGCAGKDVPRPQVQPPPSVAKMAGNFAKATARHLSTGAVHVPKEIEEMRGDICRECPYWDAGARLGLGKCLHPKCGCTSVKWKWASESCPIGKWSAWASPDGPGVGP